MIMILFPVIRMLDMKVMSDISNVGIHGGIENVVVNSVISEIIGMIFVLILDS